MWSGKFIKEYRIILYVSWKNYNNNEPINISQHKGYESYISGNFLSIRYHRLYQEKHIVQSKHTQVIHNHLVVMQQTAPKFDQEERIIWN